jgi:broad specificity phosphatase PhoE
VAAPGRVSPVGKEDVSRRVLALIRHGEYAQPAGVPSAHLPYGLTAIGVAQAREAALAVLDFARRSALTLEPSIDCSRMRRAWETAHLLGLELQRNTGLTFDCQEFDELAERSVGAVANLRMDAIEAILREDPRCEAPPPGWKRDSDYRLPFQGCESLVQAGTRAARHLWNSANALEVAGREASLKLFVGHGGAFRHAACELGVLSRTDVAQLSMGHGVPVYLEVDRAPNGRDRFVHIAGNWRQRHETQPVD